MIRKEEKEDGRSENVQQLVFLDVDGDDGERENKKKFFFFFVQGKFYPHFSLDIVLI